MATGRAPCDDASDRTPRPPGLAIFPSPPRWRDRSPVDWLWTTRSPPLTGSRGVFQGKRNAFDATPGRL